jgi:hypothetical protein
MRLELCDIKSHFTAKIEIMRMPKKFDKNPDAMLPSVQRGVTYRGRGPLAVSSPRDTNTL